MTELLYLIVTVVVAAAVITVLARPLEMIWRDMGPPLPVEVTVENSATKAHEMYSVFLEAKSAQIVVNGTPLAGSVQNRQIFGRTMSTAFLAFSETWVTPEGGN